MKTSLKCLVAVQLLVCHAAHGSILNFEGGLPGSPPLPNIVDSSGSGLVTGNEVRFGVFADGNSVLSPSAVSANSGSLSWVTSHWQTFGTTTINNLFDGTSGTIFGSLSSSDSFFDGKKIYLLAFKTPDAARPVTDFKNVAEYGVFSSSAVNWKFAGQTAIPNFTDISTVDVNEAFWGLANGSSLQLAEVPEPSAYAAAAGLALVVFAGVRTIRARRATLTR